jgi:hypothetical protein
MWNVQIRVLAPELLEIVVDRYRRADLLIEVGTLLRQFGNDDSLQPLSDGGNNVVFNR